MANRWKEPRIKIYELNDDLEAGYVVSEHGTWVAGTYATAEAAEVAVDVDVDELSKLWARVRPRNITLEDLEPLRSASG